MAVRIGSARIDENGKARGGKAGDQTGGEVSAQDWYRHEKGWIVLRANKAEERERIALAMERACANVHIGYDQGERNTLYEAAKSCGFDPGKVRKDVECDCSSLVRVCCAYAGITLGDFRTSTQRRIMEASGRFRTLTAGAYCDAPELLLRGDILVTRTQGHTVVVLSNGAKAGQAAEVRKYPAVLTRDAQVFPQPPQPSGELRAGEKVTVWGTSVLNSAFLAVTADGIKGYIGKETVE